MNFLTRLNVRWLMIIAGALHLATALTVFIVGRFRFLPNLFDEHGVATAFAPDGLRYQREIASLVDILSRDGIAAWFKASPQLHVKLYSLPVAAFGRQGDFNFFALEPLNILYYLMIVFLTFKLAEEVFDKRVGLCAAAIVALWPSLLLHTTQLLRDPLYIVLMLALVLLMTRWVTRIDSWKQGLLAGVAGAATVILLLVVRADMWNVARFAVLLGAASLAYRMLRERRLLTGNLLSLVFILAVTLSAPQIITAVERSDFFSGGTPVEQQKRPLRERIEKLRYHAIEESDENDASNIDMDVKLETWADIVGYLPRAAEVGCFAPFPWMWFTAGGRVGILGRFVSGLETLLMYAFELMALVCLWRRRRELPVWLLFLIALAGMTALGLVVVNVGTLYRLRYIFLILIVILGVEGARQLQFLASWREKTKPFTQRRKRS